MSNGSYVISVTGLRIRKPWHIFRFYWHAVRIKMACERAPGNVLTAVTKKDGFQHTLTVWESKKQLLAFVYSSPHQEAIDIFHEIATGSTCSFSSESVPSMEEAIEYWREHGKDYTRPVAN